MNLPRTTGYPQREPAPLPSRLQSAIPEPTDNVFRKREVGPSSKFRAPILLPAAFALGLSGCRSTPPPTPLDQLNVQQSHGHEVFQARCAACHYDRQSGSLHGPSLLGLFKKPALPSGAAPTDERVSATILHGRNMMPPMGAQLDDADLNDLLAYLHTL